MAKQPSKTYLKLKEEFPSVLAALEQLGLAAKDAGPVDAKTGQLIQLAAAATVHSEGAVHSHVQRALEAGATSAEIRHTILLLTSTIGYPTVAAALTWANDVIEGKR
jgi:AhpD family alkylhydroperoxidase